MSKKSQREYKQQVDSFSEALTRIEQTRKSGATELDLSGLGLTELPESLGQLTQLRLLDLAANQLMALPESLRQLKSLERLLDTFPRDICDIRCANLFCRNFRAKLR